MQVITVSNGETTISTPDQALALQVLAGMKTADKSTQAVPGVPEVGQYWPGEGGVNGGLFPGGGTPYYLIVPTGDDVEAELEWGGYGKELDGAKSPHDGLANTAYLIDAGNEHPAAQYCAGFERDGHKDFYLMARREAHFLEITVSDLFSKSWYWTSSQFSADFAYLMDFEDGWLSTYGKLFERLVRPVRRKFL